MRPLSPPSFAILQPKPQLIVTLLIAMLLLAAPALSDDIQSSATDTIDVTDSEAPKLALAVLSGRSLFGSAQTSLSETGRAALVKLIDDLRNYESIVSIRIVGHTDDVGGEVFNESLSLKRAEAVASVISASLQSTTPTIRISTLGAGESYPVATNTSASGRARNRRVEIQVLATARSQK